MAVPLHKIEKIRFPFNDFWRHIVSCSHSLNDKMQPYLNKKNKRLTSPSRLKIRSCNHKNICSKSYTYKWLLLPGEMAVSYYKEPIYNGFGKDKLDLQYNLS